MIRISACVITKNEAENLPRWFKSTRLFADEIIVVDTGSTDQTVEIAETEGAKVFHFAWCDDFAAAKNFAIEKATGDWISFLDADEYFEDEDALKLPMVLEIFQEQEKIAGLNLWWVNIDKDTGEIMGTSAYVSRIFRNVPWIRYEGSIHEHLKNLRQGVQLELKYVEGLTIYHTGYSSSIIRKKSERNLRLLLERREKIGEQPMDNFHLMDAYYALSDFENARIYAEKAARDSHRAVGMEQRPYLVWVQTLLNLKAENDEILQVLAEAKKKYPKLASFWILAGEQAWNQRDYVLAEKEYLHALEIYDDTTEDSARPLRAMVYAHLGEIAKRKHQYETAKEYFLLGVQRKPYFVYNIFKLLELLKDMDDVDLIALLNQFYDKKKDAKFLVSVLSEKRRYKAALYYDRMGGGELLSEELRYLFAGKKLAAAAAMTDRMERDNVLVTALAEKMPPEKQNMLSAILPKNYWSDEYVLTDADRRVWNRIMRTKAFFESKN